MRHNINLDVSEMSADSFRCYDARNAHPTCACATRVANVAVVVAVVIAALVLAAAASIAATLLGPNAVVVVLAAAATSSHKH